jgi:hypothetical protein
MMRSRVEGLDALAGLVTGTYVLCCTAAVGGGGGGGN